MLIAKRIITLGAVLLAILFVARAVVCAQEREHEVRAAAQYQWLHLPGTTFPVGVNGEVSAAIRTPFVLVVEGGWAPKHVVELSTNARMIDFGAGVRLMSAAPKFRPFVQVIAGGINLGVRGTVGSVTGSASQTWFQLEPGAGVHVDVRPKAAIVASVHVRWAFLDQAAFEPPGQKQFRALAGVSVQLFN
jgi:hypothetical protein